MGLRGTAAIVGYEEWPTSRRARTEPAFELDQWAQLAAGALRDCGLEPRDVDGLVCTGLREADKFAPSTLVEYLGCEVSFAERVDLGGAAAVSMVGRAAMAIEAGVAEVVVCAIPWGPVPRSAVDEGASASPRHDFGTSSEVWGAPQAEFDVPYGNVGQNAGYALIAQDYRSRFGLDERALAKIVSDLRRNSATNPGAAFHGVPITEDEILQSPMIAEPLRLFDIVMPCFGGSAIVITSIDRARDCAHRPVRVSGFGERSSFKSPTWAPDLLATPGAAASEAAFAMAGVRPREVDLAQAYDCYTISAVLALEDAGFCERGEGCGFVADHDLTWTGDFPLNTHGGQLACGQPGLAGGMSLVIEGVRQTMRRAKGRQLPACDTVWVSGTGGVMSVQSSLVLRGDG